MCNNHGACKPHPCNCYYCGAQARWQGGLVVTSFGLFQRLKSPPTLEMVWVNHALPCYRREGTGHTAARPLQLPGTARPCACEWQIPPQAALVQYEAAGPARSRRHAAWEMHDKLKATKQKQVCQLFCTSPHPLQTIHQPASPPWIEHTYTLSSSEACGVRPKQEWIQSGHPNHHAPQHISYEPARPSPVIMFFIAVMAVVTSST